MALKSYGKIIVEKKTIIITSAEPHVSMKLKSIFPKIPASSQPPYRFPLTDDTCHDFIWFMVRYPFTMTKEDLTVLLKGSSNYKANQSKVEELCKLDYVPKEVQLSGKLKPRNYQLLAAEIIDIRKRLLLGDDIGLGKTLSSILVLCKPGNLPAAVVMQTHMQKQWENNIQDNTNLKAYRIKKTKPYPLPKADVYLFKYTQLAGWVNYFEYNPFKAVIYDEIQELRRSESLKYKGAQYLSRQAEIVIGLSATPVYNYGDEIYNVIEIIKEDFFGKKSLFLNEWCVPQGMDKYKVKDPDALGSYLKETGIILRRTRKEVGRELPPVNKIVVPVDYDEEVLKESNEISRALALKVLDPSIAWQERGKAALDLDLRVRRDTGISKAKSVAAFVRMIVEGGEKVLLAGWHRDVYDIWLKELEDLKPVMYTGSETAAQKDAAKNSFVEGDAKVMIMSLRSGAGLDGLQKACHVAVIGEFDWSPKVHDQFIGRLDRDGNEHQVTAFYTASDYGSDPPMLQVLGLKQAQSHGIMNPGILAEQQYSDESRVKLIAERFLNRK